MSKKVLIISTSPRKGGNSELLADNFRKGALNGGHSVEMVSLHDKTIGFCKGCLSCNSTQRCIIHDDADIIREKMLTADVLVFSTPIYYYEMCGQMKTMLDRSNPLFSSTYAFRQVYLLTTAADTDESASQGAIKGMEGWISCFGKAKLMGVVNGLGATDIGDINGNPALQQAYEMGLAL